MAAVDFRATLAIALSGMATNKARTALTLLGVIIGVASVITAVAIGTGAQAQVLNQINGLGTNLLTVSPGASFFGGVRGAAGSQVTLSENDAEIMAEEANPSGALPDVAEVAPEFTTNVQVVDGTQNASTTADGVTPEYLSARNWQVAEGSFISATDVQQDNKVCDLGASVITDLFNGNPSVDLIGTTIELNGEPYQVIGVMASKGQSGGGNQDDRIFVPISDVQDRLARVSGAANRVSDINVVATSQDTMTAAQTELETLLRRLHRLTPTQQDDFSIQSQTQIQQTATNVTGILTVVLGAIAAVSLLVGGIGIMNIMLVTVTERTREIGLRKAVGARRSDILAQFLLEAILISGVGGLLGVLISYGMAWVLPSLTAGTGFAMQPVVSNGSVGLALGVSVGIGLFFGGYPASRAAALDPIQALRYE
jgi:putative ABC transport system permease protein